MFNFSVQKAPWRTPLAGVYPTRRGVDGQKSPKSCQRSLWSTPFQHDIFCRPELIFITDQDKIKRSYLKTGIISFYLAKPMTPQAKRPPAFPVALLNSWPPLPKSSMSAWITIVRPRNQNQNHYRLFLMRAKHPSTI